MSRLLIKNGELIGLGKQDILIEGSYIVAIEESIDVDGTSQSNIIDAKNKLIYPGFVNTHHHLTQSLAKAVPAGINCDLNAWLPAVPFALFDKLTPEIVYYSAVMGLYELVRSGCTTCADHFYIYHKQFDFAIERALLKAAEDVGVRFVLCRGGSTHVGSHKGVRSTNIDNEDLDLYLSRIEETVKQHHQTKLDAMCRIAVAPTTIVHSSPLEELKEISAFARRNNLRMHSHMLEVSYDEEMAKTNYAMKAVDYAESAGWLGDDVWFAHLVQADSYTIDKLATTQTGIAHCPSSNCRLGSGIAPIPKMANKGMPISIGVDGSASAESASMITELSLTWLLHRATSGANATDAQQVLKWASESGAQILGFEKLGTLAPGYLADLSIINLDQARFDGVWMKNLAPILCGEPVNVETVLVNGKVIYSAGNLANLDMTYIRHKAQNCVEKLMKSVL